MGLVREIYRSLKLLNVMTKKVLVILIVGGLLVSIISCGPADKDKRNYTLCRQRIIEYAETLDPNADSYAEQLKQKLGEYFSIYGYRSMAEFAEAKNKYEHEVGNPADRETLTEILKQIGAVYDTAAAQPAAQEEPEKPTDKKVRKKAGPGEFSEIKNKALSLKALLQKLQEYRGGRKLPGEITRLGGMTRLLGYMIDRENRDVILLGDVEEKKPPLCLDDFVIALRNAWFKYAELRGDTHYYSNPGCSIDPDPAVLQKLNNVSSRISGSRQVKEKEKAIKQWGNVCASPQKVRVMGIPFHSRFAWVMVKADYDMKRIVDGSDSLGLPGFKSLIDIEMDQSKAEIVSGESSTVPGVSMNRFWFYPGKTHFLEDEDMVLIDSCDVLLLTEEEFLTKKGDVEGTGRPNKNAKLFSNAFSALYPEVAALRPIYRELDNMFRFVALSKALKFKSAFKGAGLNIDYLLDQYPVREKRVEETLPGIANVKRFEYRRNIEGGHEDIHLWLPSCGGVSVDIEVGEGSFGKPPSDGIKGFKDSVSKDRGSGKNLSWDFKCLVMRKPEVDRLKKINSLNKEDFSTFTIVNHLSHSKLYYDSGQSILDSDNKLELLQAVLSRAGNNNFICLDLKDYSRQQAELFVFKLQLIAADNDMEMLITAIPRMGNSTDLRDLICLPVDEIKMHPKGKSKLEKVKQGGLSGWFRRGMAFSMRKGAKKGQVDTGAFAKDPQTLIDFYEAVEAQVSSSQSSQVLMKDISRALKKLIKQNKGKTFKEIIMDIVRHLRGADFGYLWRQDRQNKQMMKAAA